MAIEVQLAPSSANNIKNTDDGKVRTRPYK